MRTILIIAGVILLIWLGYLTVDRNSIQLHLNRHDERFDQMQSNIDGLDDRYELKEGVISEENPVDKVEDELDKAEDKFDQNIEMPYEDKKTNENTDLKKDDNALPQADKEEIKTDVNMRERLENGMGLGINEPSEVAFADVTDHLYKGKESIEAYQFNVLQDDAIVAFKVR